MYRKTKTLLFMAAVAVLSACNQTQQVVARFEPPAIDLPLRKEVVEYAIYTISPAEGGSFETDRGTRVAFPADAFVFEDGSRVTEPVQIKFREYHTASEILLSGIRMTAKSETGETLPFESAGMFDIDGSCGNKKVKIARGKSALINLSSSKSDTDFNFYRLEESGWVELQKNLPATENPAPQEWVETANAEIPKAPLEPTRFDEKEFVFDLDMDLTRYPELKEMYGMMWQYNGPQGTDTDPETNKKITETAWTSSFVERNDDMTFTLVLRRGKEIIRIPVQPVLAGKNYEEAKARFNKKMENYKEAVARRERAQQMLQARDDYSRALAVAGFGIYNCDRFYRMPNAQQTQPIYTYNDSRLPEGTVLYHIAKNDVVIRIYSESMPFTYSGSEKNRLIAIMPDGTAAALDAAEFAAATSTRQEETEFFLKKLKIKSITPENLGEAIAGI